MDRSTARALQGALALAAAMGIGRFAYTALLPATQRALGIGDRSAGALASLNLAGYLAGVVVARQLSSRPGRGALLRLGLALVAFTTLVGAFTSSPGVWSALRFTAGVASGLVFVLASAAALEGAASRPGLLYAGVGPGIALSGAVAALGGPAAPSGPAWSLLGIAAGLLSIPAWLHLASSPPRAAASAQPRAAPTLTIGRLAAAYFLEGLGYIVSGTFAVAAVRRVEGLAAFAPWTWVLTGVAAAPSALFWTAVGARFGPRRGLIAAHLLQGAGMALSASSNSPLAVLLGGAVFGGTFMGIVTLAMEAGRDLAPGAPGRIVGTLTAVYGVGQIVGPLAAGAISERLGDPRPAVLMAAAAVALGGALLGLPSHPPVREAGLEAPPEEEDACRT